MQTSLGETIFILAALLLTIGIHSLATPLLRVGRSGD